MKSYVLSHLKTVRGRLIRSMTFIFFGVRIMVMVFNATFNNISVISWRSVLLMEETEVPGESHRPIESH